MTVHSFWQQSLTYPAAEVRNLSGLWWPGADGVRFERGANPLLVSAQAVPDMSVQVAAGWAKSAGYLGWNDGVLTVDLDAADPSNPRIDLIVMRWQDLEAGDGSSEATVEVVKGAPSANPQVPSTVGMNVVELAQVAVAAATVTIAGAAITDVRPVIQTQSDSRWLNLISLAAGWIVPPNEVAQARQIGNVVYLRGFLQNADFDGGFTRIADLPNGVTKPPPKCTHPVFSVGGATGVASRSIQLTDDGQVQAFTSAATSAYYSLNGMFYLVDDN